MGQKTCGMQERQTNTNELAKQNVENSRQHKGCQATTKLIMTVGVVKISSHVRIYN